MSDEVSQFLEQVEKLRGQQIEEDEVRARELEEYLAAKRERQARREERARSISPQKSSPANTPSPRSNRRSVYLSDATRLDSPSASAAHPDIDQTDDESSMMAQPGSSPTKENESPSGGDAPSKRGSNATPPARSSTLSWQRRPESRGGGRPLSMVAAQNATQRSLRGSQEVPPAADEPASRDQIAQSLGSKDPTWFRQTADRGLGSAAFRRNQVEDDDRLDMASVKAQLPGMSTDTPKDRSASTISDTPRQEALASPLPLNPPSPDKHDEPSEEPPSPDKSTSMGHRRSQSRSTSPTKGMGGFVQSAMMKRSDSVKRWTVTSPPTLSRLDSVTTNRTGTLERLTSQSDSKPISTSRGPSTTPGNSRPTSRHGEENVPEDDLRKSTSVEPLRTDDASLPSSPSKTMDPRRWSPTKASWLESALNKPESPKPQAKAAASSQPAWMAELNKNKGGNSGSEGGRPLSVSHKHQVSIGGLMRSSPMGTTEKPNTPGLGGIYSPPPTGNKPRFGQPAKPVKSVSKTTSPEPIESQRHFENMPIQPVDGPSDPEPSATATQQPSASIKPKPKPETPPKKDFRSTLKQRSADSGPKKTEEPEFKNVFGNLRRTQTQNYVAPDELKSNIMRGKAGLNATGGPKKSERKDEFKDAILQKKDDFKKAQSEGKGVARSSTTTTEKPVPEGLAKRAELGRSKSISRRDASSETRPIAQPKKPEQKPSPGPKRVPSQSSLMSSPPASASTPSKTGDTPRRAHTETDMGNSAASPRIIPSLKKETSAPAKPQASHIGGGKFADRFNPGLAGMLARGPPPASANGGRSGSSTDKAAPTETTEPAAPGPQLSHMTKNRARGPRRKAPTTTQAPVTVAATSHASTPAASQLLQPSSPEVRKASPRLSPKPQEKRPLPSPAMSAAAPDNKPDAFDSPKSPPSIQEQVALKAAVRSKPSPSRPIGRVPSDNLGQDIPQIPSSAISQRLPPAAEKPKHIVDSPAPLRIHKTGDVSSQPGSPKKLDVKRISKFMDEKNGDAKSAEPAFAPLTRHRTGSRSPEKMSYDTIPSPTKVDSAHVASVRDATAAFGSAKAPPPKPQPLRNTMSPQPEPARSETPTSTRPLPEPTRSGTPLSTRPLPEPARSGTPTFARPLPEPTRSGTPASARPLPMPPTSQQMRDPSPAKTASQSSSSQGGSASAILDNFFGPNRVRKTFRVDPAEILMNRPTAGAKVKSTGSQVVQITGDGKMMPVPTHLERVLFEQEMYICSHDFTTSTGRKLTEVYFWVGDGVPASRAEDAQLFAKREARSLGCNLIKLRQGKETAEFVQALGGVIIVRRGSSTKYDSLAPNMLCGRHYLGQVAFDEVDIAPASLCAGFPYLIAQGGTCYLWKGKGSGVDELGCARLIGMEMALTGELTEVEDGREPDSFWEVFGPGARKPHSADHWRLKPSYDKYCSRLFSSDADGLRQITEISPFNQSDLSATGISILDAFFEVYIVVGHGAQSQYASFRNALDFAHEYAILAAGVEDRPFVPVSTVVVEGAPRDLRCLFRKWDDARSPTVMQALGGDGGLKRGRSLKVVPLTQALLAFKD